jgi:hypothetical protein
VDDVRPEIEKRDLIDGRLGGGAPPANADGDIRSTAYMIGAIRRISPPG